MQIVGGGGGAPTVKIGGGAQELAAGAAPGAQLYRVIWQ